MVGLKYSMNRRVRWTIAKAFCKSLSPMNFVIMYSVQGGLAVIISKYPLGYADAKSHCRMSVVMVACDSGSHSSKITLKPCRSRVRRTLPEPENKSSACRDFFSLRHCSTGRSPANQVNSNLSAAVRFLIRRSTLDCR